MDIRVGKRATVVIPAQLRRRMGVDEGDVLHAWVNEHGQLVLTPVATEPRQRLSQAMTRAFADAADPVEMIRALRDEWDD